MVDVGLKITLVGVDKKKTLVNTCKNKAWLMSTIKPSNDNQKKKFSRFQPKITSTNVDRKLHQSTLARKTLEDVGQKISPTKVS